MEGKFLIYSIKLNLLYYMCFIMFYVENKKNEVQNLVLES